ncbi:hypothetical protein DDZ18_01080 [Marinicauda salina]|uniref:Lipoprotein n=1 Tax=Marinicauda salina TaxID=2135793 RepID=A0A2U2BW40_9PROT|nr:hypothetical protein [Marinicauda salina]PWE18233.1 hypothetical protein DDZ18_01080 [Marinicauda salina]
MPAHRARNPIDLVIRAAALAGLAATLSGCALVFPEGDTVCPDQGPNSPSWPYCGPAEPGGPQPTSGPRPVPSGTDPG